MRNWFQRDMPSIRIINDLVIWTFPKNFCISICFKKLHVLKHRNVIFFIYLHQYWYNFWGKSNWLCLDKIYSMEYNIYKEKKEA